LWKKIAWDYQLAGAVGSGATLVNRERERRAFAGSYWDLKSTLEQGKTPFAAGLVKLGGTRLATVAISTPLPVELLQGAM